MSDIPPIEPDIAPPPPATPLPAAVPELPPLLGRLPVPWFVTALAVITAIAFLFGVVRTPHVVNMAVKNEQGQRALEHGDADKAVGLFKQVNAAYPFSKDVSIELADANERAGNLQDAAMELQAFEGLEVSKDQEERLNGITSRVQSDIDAIDKKDPKK